jgi:hypothetical protein
MNNLYGGYIKSSFASHIIRSLSTRHNQTDDMKRYINRTITDTGHGSMFLGSSARLENGDRNIRILVGAHFSRHGKLKIGVFGGKCEKGEMTIDTVIRETIEEIFNFPASASMIYHIRTFLNDNPEFYYIYKFSESSNAYSYFFDVSILGDFIRIIKSIPEMQKVVLLIPANDGMANVENFLQTDINMKDFSSFDGPNSAGTDTTIKLVEFMKTRYISWKFLKMQQERGIKKIPGLDEIKYLSFVSLKKIVAAVPFQRYDLYNFTKNKRENLEMQQFLVKLLIKDIIDEILKFE